MSGEAHFEDEVPTTEVVEQPESDGVPEAIEAEVTAKYERQS